MFFQLSRELTGCSPWNRPSLDPLPVLCTGSHTIQYEANLTKLLRHETCASACPEDCTRVDYRVAVSRSKVDPTTTCAYEDNVRRVALQLFREDAAERSERGIF